jgi:hypothetical protein
VDGEKLVGCMELLTGNLVYMGNTLFTIIPQNQFWFCFKGVFACGQHYPAINYAFLCSRLKLIKKFILKNYSETKTEPFHIELSIGWFGRCSLDIPALAGYEEQQMDFIVPNQFQYMCLPKIILLFKPLLVKLKNQSMLAVTV